MASYSEDYFKRLPFAHIFRSKLGVGSLRSIPLINALPDDTLGALLAKRGCMISDERNTDVEKLRLQVGDVLFVVNFPDDLISKYDRIEEVDISNISVYRYIIKEESSADENKQETRALSPVREVLRQIRKEESKLTKQMEKQTRGWVGIQAAGIVQEMVIKYPEKVFFTADTHFSSDRVLPFRRRYSTKEEMNAALVKLWNETVPPDGIVFHLGDFAYGSMLQIQALANSLNGTIYLITGNHDSEPAFICQAGDEMPKIIPLGHYFSVRILGRKFELSHYPFLCYEGEHAGVIQLFGHVHSGGEDEGFDIPRLQYLLPFQYDVGIDNNNDRPVSFMKILEMFPFDPGPTIDVSAKMYPYLINEVQAIAGDFGLDFPAEVLLNDIELGYARTLRIRGEVVGYFAIVPAGSGEGIGWLENGGLCCYVRRFVCALGGSGCVKKIINAAHTNYDDIRILTPTDDVDIELRRLGFQYHGEIVKDGVVLKGYQKIYK